MTRAARLQISARISWGSLAISLSLLHQDHPRDIGDG